MSQLPASYEDTNMTVLPYAGRMDWLRLFFGLLLWGAGRFGLTGQLQVICQALAAVLAAGDSFYRFFNALTKPEPASIYLAASLSAIVGFLIGEHNAAAFLLLMRLAVICTAGSLLQLQRSRHSDLPVYDQTVMQKLLKKVADVIAFLIIIAVAAVAVFTAFTGSVSWKKTGFISLILLAFSTCLIPSAACRAAFIRCRSQIQKKGIRLRSTRDLESLSVFDYLIIGDPDLLTSGEYHLSHIDSSQERDVFLKTAASIAHKSNHPFAEAIVREYGQDEEYRIIHKFREDADGNMEAYLGQKRYILGNYQYLREIGITPDQETDDSVLYLYCEEECLGQMTFQETIREEEKTALIRLRHQGVRKTGILTTQSDEKVQRLKELLLLDEVQGDLDNEGKVEQIRLARTRNYAVGYVEEGNGDGAAMAMANLGLACGADRSFGEAVGSDGILDDASLKLLAEGRQTALENTGMIKGMTAVCLAAKVILITLAIGEIIPPEAVAAAEVLISSVIMLKAVREKKNH